MKVLRENSWNNKWHLKEGSNVGDDSTLLSDFTLQNNLDPTFSSTLIRIRRSNNNQPDNMVPVNVPGDGSCLFWAVTLAYLIPVKDDENAFSERFNRLFGDQEPEHIEHVRNLVEEYDPHSNNVQRDEVFNRLVTEVLRGRVVDHMSSELNRGRFIGYVTGDFNEYLNNMRMTNTWGDEPEIRAMSEMFGAAISVHPVGTTYNENGDISIRLYHVNAAGGTSQGNVDNHYNFGLERSLHQQITNNVVPELVDHMFRISENDNNFKQRFQSFLDQIPRPSGVGAAPAKKGFYVSFFAGMFTTLKNTKLFNRLNLVELHFKLATISDADEVPFLKIVAITEDPKTKKLGQHVFVISEKRYNRQTMGAIFSKKDNNWLRESQLLFSDQDNQYNLRSRAHTRADEIEFKSGAAIIIGKSWYRNRNKDKIYVRTEQLTDQELPEEMNFPFRRIEKHHKYKIGDYKSNFLEDIVNNLSKEVKNNPREDERIVQAVAEDIRALLRYIYAINRKYYSKLPNIPGALEAGDHGFTAGVLINFRKRYNLELYSELLLGIEGYIDLALLVRGSERVKNAIPILIEIKTGQEQGARTNPQRALEEAEGYTDGLQQNNRPFVTLTDRVVRVGFNMDYADPIKTSVAQLQPPAPIINTIFKSVNSKLKKQRRLNDIKATITDQLKKIHKLSPGTQGSGESQYLSRLFIGHSILNSVDLNQSGSDRLDKYIFTYKKSKKTTRETRQNHVITTSVFVKRVITGSNTGDSKVLIVHFHEGGRTDVGINESTLRVPLNGIVSQANCKEIIEIYVNARSDENSLRFLTEDGSVLIQDFTNSVNDYFGADVANYWIRYDMPSFDQVKTLKQSLDAAMHYQPQRDSKNKVDLGPYSHVFNEIGQNLFPIKDLISKEAYFQAVLSGLLNSYSDIEFERGEFKINVRSEFQVGGGGRIDLLMNIMSKEQFESDVLIGLELKYGDGRTTVDSMKKNLEKAEKIQLRRYGISRNIRAITEGANFLVTLPIGFVSRAETADSLLITGEKFVAHDIERSFISQNQPGSSIAQNTLEAATQNGNYEYWLSDQDIRRIAHLDNTYSNMFDVHAMSDNYDTSNRGLVVVTDRDHDIDDGELYTQVHQFIEKVNNNEIVLQQGTPTRIFIINQGGNHWTSLVIVYQNGQYQGYYQDSLGGQIPDNIGRVLAENNVTNLTDLQIRQQTDGYNCGLWALDNARYINTMLQENKNIDWLRAMLVFVTARNGQYFKDKREELASLLRNSQAQEGNSQNRSTDSTSDVDSHPPSSQCLNGSRKKRSVNKCLYSWDDVDKFNSEQQNKRNIDYIKIDSKKFLEYSKNIQDETKNMQLLALANERIAVSDSNIVGGYKYLLNDVIQDGGYDSYVQNDRIKDLAYDVHKDHTVSRNSQLKGRLLNAAGKIQLTRGIHSTIASCQSGSTENCALSVGGLSYAVLSQPIENVMVKFTPRIVNMAAKNVGKVVPRISGYNIKLVIQIGGMKYGTKMAGAAAGALAGVFDIVDIGLSANNLVQCNARENSDNPCSDKEIRDNIASITFSGVSFVSGVLLTAAGFGPLAIAVGLGLMVGYGIYSGISNIIEYEQKYDTTHNENWRLFLDTFFLQVAPLDVQHLAGRQEVVNNLVKNAWNVLEYSPDDVVAYAMGLGEIQYRDTNCRKELGGCLGDSRCSGKYIQVCDKQPIIVASKAVIDMSRSNDRNIKKLSRVLPYSIENATMICLPKITNADYEKGITNTVSTAVHYCENAVVMLHNQRKLFQNNNQWIIYDLKYINGGFIIGSDKLHNMFLLSERNVTIFSKGSVTNKFVFTSDKFLGFVSLSSNATNIFTTEQLTNEVIDARITDNYSSNKGGLLALNGHSFTVGYFYNNTKLYYVGRNGRKNKVDNIKVDNIVCESLHLINVDSLEKYYKSGPDILIDSGGGYSNGKKDLIENCAKAIVRPFTNIKGNNGTYTFHIKMEGYENQISSSTINVQGNGIIAFPDISLFKDCEQISYSSKEDRLFFKIGVGQNGTFTLDVRNYLNENNNANFVLIDKYGSNVVPKLDNNSTIINKFELYTRYSLDDLNIAKNYYKNISSTDKNYKIFGVIHGLENDPEKIGKMFIGSSSADIIYLDKQAVFAEGGEEQDIYIIDDDLGENIVTINNESKDKKLDFLIVQSFVDYILLEQEDDDLSLFIEKQSNNTTAIDSNIIVRNYFLGKEHQHFIVMDKNNSTFIPIKLDKNSPILVPFYYASSTNVFILPVSVNQAVINNKLKDIEFYRDNNDLLLLEKNIAENTNPLTVILKDFYSNPSKWKEHRIYTYSSIINGDYDRIDLLQKSFIALNFQQYNYKKIVEEYIIDFSQPITTITIDHNQKLINGTLFPVEQSEEKTGVIILRNIAPEQIIAYKDGDNDLLLYDKNFNKKIVRIRNWYDKSVYRIDRLEFDLGLNPITIRGFDQNSDEITDLQRKVHYASEIYKQNQEIESLMNYDMQRTLRCVMSINSLNSTESYTILACSTLMLGFDLLQDQIDFTQKCDFDPSQLSKLKDHINDDLLQKYRARLVNSLMLNNYNDPTASQCEISMRSRPIFSVYSEVVKEIDNIILKLSNSTESLRNRREVNIADNQEQLSLVDYDDIAPVSSGSSRVEFWPIKELKSITTAMIDAMKYFVGNPASSPVQSAHILSNVGQRVYGNTYNYDITYHNSPRVSNTTNPRLDNMSNNTESRYNYENFYNREPNSDHSSNANSTRGSQEYMKCVPYIWDIDSQEYVTEHVMDCTLPHGQIKVFSNIHQSSNTIQNKDYHISRDTYKNCRPIEFYGRSSVYCEGNRTNMVYTANIQYPSLDAVNGQLMLARAFGIDKLIEKLITKVKILLGSEQSATNKDKEDPNPNYIMLVKITAQQRDTWQFSIKNIEDLIETLSSRADEENNKQNLNWAIEAKFILKDRVEEINNLSWQQSLVDFEVVAELNKNLECLQMDLEESINSLTNTGDQCDQSQEFAQTNDHQQQCDSRYNYPTYKHLVHNMSMLQAEDSNDIISAIKDNDLIRVRDYLEAGEDVNACSRGGMTLLMRAVSNESCCPELVELLIKYGADVNVTDSSGETAINLASYNGHLKLIKILISGGAIVKNKTEQNSPFSSVAESSQHQNIKNEIIKLLSRNLNSVDSSNNNILTDKKLNKDNYVISNLVEQMSAMNSSSGNTGSPIAGSISVVPSYLSQNPSCYNEVINAILR